MICRQVLPKSRPLSPSTRLLYAALMITGGRLGDIFGRKRIFVIGVIGFTLASLWCGLAWAAPMLILARAAQGASAALMVPQVLASIHTLFPDGARTRAFAVFGIAVGLGAAVGFMLGGWLVTLNLAGLGWRGIFCVNVPAGLAIVVAALVLMPPMRGDPGTRLDLAGASMLFAGLLGVLVPLMFGHELGWPWWLWLVVAAGAAALAGFMQMQRVTQLRGGAPLIDLAILSERGFTSGMGATFCFFLANLSFYFVLTLFMQNHLGLSPFNSALTVLPMALAFVAGSRLAAGRLTRRGLVALIEGCVVEVAGLAATALLIGIVPHPTMAMLMLPLAVFGYGQGMVLAPLFNAVLANVGHAHAGSGSGMLATTQQIANGTGVVVVGAVYFAVQGSLGGRDAMLTAMAVLACAIVAAIGFLQRMRVPSLALTVPPA